MNHYIVHATYDTRIKIYKLPISQFIYFGSMKRAVCFFSSLHSRSLSLHHGTSSQSRERTSITNVDIFIMSCLYFFYYYSIHLVRWWWLTRDSTSIDWMTCIVMSLWASSRPETETNRMQCLCNFMAFVIRAHCHRLALSFHIVSLVILCVWLYDCLSSRSSSFGKKKKAR